ncbi:MAG: flavin reductase family protein [Caldiserica bacterium]|nr:flavin reductase family protein [Caldisericota bacterium]
MKVRVSNPLRLIATRPTMIVTTVHENGKVNGGTFGAYTNLSPTLIGIAISRASDTYRNIKRTGELVLNIPGIELADATFNIFGKHFPKNVSEVEEAGVSTVEGEIVKVPMIKECKANIECKYVKEMPVNYHVFVVVEALAGWCEEELKMQKATLMW